MRTFASLVLFAAAACLVSSTMPTSQAGYIPPGSTIEVRNNAMIFAGAGSEGATYPATVARHIRCGGMTVPADSPAQLVVLRLGKGPSIGGGQLQLGLSSITVRGCMYRVRRAGALGGPLGTLKGSLPAAGMSFGDLKIVTKGALLQVPPEMIMIFKINEPLYLYSN